VQFHHCRAVLLPQRSCWASTVELECCNLQHIPTRQQLQTATQATLYTVGVTPRAPFNRKGKPSMPGRWGVAHTSSHKPTLAALPGSVHACASLDACMRYKLMDAPAWPNMLYGIRPSWPMTIILHGSTMINNTHSRMPYYSGCTFGRKRQSNQAVWQK
jgi:hypothetical protein